MTAVPPAALKIRPAQPSDATVLHELVCELAVYEREPAAVEATPEDFLQAGFGEHPAFEALIAEWEGAAVGMALFFPVFSTWKGKQSVHLEDLFVRRTYRGKGIGRALFAAVARIAVDRGAPRYEWQVLDWNQPAIDFYQGHGARPLRQWIPFRLTGRALSRLAGEAPPMGD